MRLRFMYGPARGGVGLGAAGSVAPRAGQADPGCAVDSEDVGAEGPGVPHKKA